MNEKDKTLLRKFLEGRCNDAELLQVARILRDQEANDILDQLMEEEAIDEWTAPLEKDDVEYTNERIAEDRKSTRLNSSHVKISYAVFCLKKKSTKTTAGLEEQ